MACLMNYTIGCREARTGQVGDFLFDVEHWQKTGEFVAISPMFDSLESFFAWDDAHGRQRKSIYAERVAAQDK